MRVKNGRVGYKNLCPINREKKIIYIPKTIKYIPPNKYKNKLNTLNIMLPLILKCGGKYNDLLLERDILKKRWTLSISNHLLMCN